MKCPICGNDLDTIASNEPKIDWATASDEEIDMWCEKEPDCSTKWICPTKQCFGEGFELIEHHPLRGMKSAPGDSWSLTWLK